MKKYFAGLIFITVAIFLSVLFPALQKGSFHFSFNSVNTSQTYSQNGEKIVVFVGGAVKNEGYYTVPLFTTYGELFENAGCFDFSATHYVLQKPISASDTMLIINIFDGEKVLYCKNINTASLSDLLSLNIEEQSAQKIIDARNQKGKFNYKSELVEKSILTQQEYDELYFKIFVR